MGACSAKLLALWDMPPLHTLPWDVPFETEKVIAARAEYWIVEATAIAVADVAVLDQPTPTCSKPSSLLWFSLGACI